MNPTNRNADRARILQALRRAVVRPKPKPFEQVPSGSVFVDSGRDRAERFARRFVQRGGLFHFCENGYADFFREVMNLSRAEGWQQVYCWEKALYDVWRDELQFSECKLGQSLNGIDAGVVRGLAAVAESGTLILSDRQLGALEMSAAGPRALIVLLRADQIVIELNAAMQAAKDQAATRLVQLDGGGYRHPFFDVGGRSLGARRVYCFLIDG